MKIAKKKIDPAAGSVTFEFDNGERLVCSASALSDDVSLDCLLHGIAQRVGDAYAGAANQPKPVEWAFVQARETWVSLVEGTFGTRSSSATERLIAAAYAVTKGDPDALREKIEAMSKAEKAELAKHPAIKLELAKMEVEALSAKASGSTKPLAI